MEGDNSKNCDQKTRKSSRLSSADSKKYSEFISDDEEGKLAFLDDSGSDFEKDLEKETRKRKMLSTSESSSQDEVPIKQPRKFLNPFFKPTETPIASEK